MHAFDSWDWRDLTFRAVAERAGVGERTVYRHFPTERHLHDAVMTRLESDAGITYEDVDLANLGDVTARFFASLQRFSVRKTVETPQDPTFVGVDVRRRDALLRAVSTSPRGGRTPNGGPRPAFSTCCGTCPATSDSSGVWGIGGSEATDSGRLADGQGRRGDRGGRPAACVACLGDLVLVTAATSPSRGKLRRFTGRTLSRLLRLPPHTNAYRVHRGVRIPMRDGVELVADHYVPATATPAGTLLVRCPYGRRFPFSSLYAGVYAARGYHVIFQSVRGTFGSGGDFDPTVNEIADGADTADWLRDQPWFTGSFGTIGLSYLGFTQWALLDDPPPEMKAAVIIVGLHDVSGPRWGAGSFALQRLPRLEQPGHPPGGSEQAAAVIRKRRARRAVARATSGLPAGEAGRALLGEAASWWEEWVDHPDVDDPFWSDTGTPGCLNRAEIPVLLIGGWQDLFLEQTLTQYDALKRRGVDVAVTVGSWTHTHLMSKAAPTVLRESLDWLDAHLAGPGHDP